MESDQEAIQRIVSRAAFRALARQTGLPGAFHLLGGGDDEPQQQQQFVYDDAGAAGASPLQQRFGGVIPFLVRLIRMTVVGSFLLSISMASHLAVYRALMPSTRATETLYFDYTGTSPSPASIVSSSGEQSDDIKTIASKLETTAAGSCADMPLASVDLFARHSSWEAHHDTVVPSPRMYRRLLDAQRAYSIEVSLTLPDSGVNQHAGVFGVVAELRSTNGTHLATSRRSVRFPHQSLWISKLRKTFCLIPLLVGALEESRTVVVPSFRHYVESATLPLQYLVVKIVPRPGRQHSDLAEINEGEIRIGEEMTEFQEFLKEWFFAVLVMGTVFYACIYVVVGFSLMALWSYIKRRYMEEEPPCELDMDYVDILPDNTPDGRGDSSSVQSQQQHQNTAEAATGEESANNFASAERATPMMPTGFDDDFGSDEWEDLNNMTRGNREGPTVVEEEEAADVQRES